MKGPTSRALRSEFEELSAMNALWTRSYFASTAGQVSSETIKAYVDSQKTRPATEKERGRRAERR